MDFDIGNIMYVVITLVAVIIGLLGRKKKPARSGTGSGESTSGGGFMENLEKAFNMGQEDQVVVDLEENETGIPIEEPEYETVTAKEATMNTPGSQREYERYIERSGDPDHDIIFSGGDVLTESMEVIQLEDEHGTDYFEVIKDFDAGTAVVYSAIINRVDY